MWSYLDLTFSSSLDGTQDGLGNPPLRHWPGSDLLSFGMRATSGIFRLYTRPPGEVKCCCLSSPKHVIDKLGKLMGLSFHVVPVKEVSSPFHSLRRKRWRFSLSLASCLFTKRGYFFLMATTFIGHQMTQTGILRDRGSFSPTAREVPWPGSTCLASG